MTDEDREFVREMMEESKSGPLLMRPVDWIVGKTFWMSEKSFSAFLSIISVLGAAAFVLIGWAAGNLIYLALCG